MTVHQLTNGVIYVGTVAGALTGIGAFAHFAIVRPVKAFLRTEVSSTLVEIRDGLADHGRRLDEHIKNGHH